MKSMRLTAPADDCTAFYGAGELQGTVRVVLTMQS
jgi:hypothetical protein